jgi:hypothetical protein
MSNFTVKQIQLLSAIKDHEQLKKQVHVLLDNCETMHPVRVVAIRNNVNNSRNIKNTISILWNMQLAGDGLSVKNSRYQKNMKNSSKMR